jgi:AraC-like DNA-binding protein
MLTQSYLTLQSGRLKPSEKWTCEGDDLFLLFPEAGAGQITAFSSNYRVAPGDMIALTGRSAAKLTAHDGGDAAELVFKWFAVSLDSLFPLFSPSEVAFLQNVTQEYRSPKIFSKSSPVAGGCRQLLREVEDKLDLIHRSQLLKVVALLLSSELNLWQQKQGGGNDSADDHMLRVFGQLSSHELLNLSVEELADKFGCSRRHLSRLFHQRFGVSVAALRMEMRLLKASSLLRDPGVKIINVADQCGFNHLGLFNTCFKRRFGVTPGVWRNSNYGKMEAGKSGGDADACPLQTNGLCPWGGRAEAPAGRPGVLKAPSGELERAAAALAAGGGGQAAGKTGKSTAEEVRKASLPPLIQARPIDGQRLK